MIEVKCPHCAYARELPQEKVPAGRRSVTCPRCRKKFSFDKNEMLSELLSASAPATAPPTGDAPSDNIDDYASIAVQDTGSGHLQPLSELFPQLWQLIKLKAWPVFATWFAAIFILILGSTIYGAACAAIIDVSGNSALVTISAVVIGSVAFCYALGWLIAATMCAIVADEISPSTALAGGMNYAWRYFWLMTLVGHMIFGGMLLLVVPGIIFYIWFYFTPYLSVVDNVRGMNALLLSREYVRGYGWGIFGRLLLFSLLIWVATLVLSFIPFIGPLPALILSPLALLLPQALYRELRELKPDLPTEFSRATKLRWVILGTLGYLTVPAAIYLGWDKLIELAAILQTVRM